MSVIFPVIVLSALPSPAARPEPAIEPIAWTAPALLAPAEEAEKTFSYTYLEVGYYSTDVDFVDESSDAVYGRASIGLFGFLHVFLDYSAESLDDVTDGIDTGDIESDNYGLGVGGHFSVSPRLDLVGEAEWLYADLSSDEFSDLDDTNNGWSAFAGGRLMALPWDRGGLELNGGFRWIDLETIASDDTVGAWEAGLRVHFLKWISIGAKYTFLEDDSRYGFDARFSL